MKIAHVLTRFSPSENPGGVERVVEEIAKRQAEKHEVELICRNQFDDDSREDYRNFTVKRADTIDFRGLRTFSSLFTMRKLIKESEADIFHIHDWSPYLNYKAASAPKKSVLTLHNLENKYIGSKIQNYVAKNAPKATAVSKWLNDRTYTTKVIYNGVDLEKFQVSEKTDNYALFVGSLTERKGALEIAKACQSQDIDLKMVGTGPLESKLSQMDVELLGNVEEEDLIQIYAKSDFLALPSRKEGFGLVWGEALSSGKPVLATKTGFGAEIPEYCGEILDPKYKLEQLKKSLDDLRNRGFETNRIRGFAEKNLEWDKITSDYLKVYRSL